MECTVDCLSLGPPPDSILRMPPPPPPAFLAPPANHSCRAAALCRPPPARDLFPGVQYHELPRHDPSVGEDTWFLVLITCCVAVLCLAALLALFLLKCRETYTFNFSDNTARKQAPAELVVPGKPAPDGAGTLYPCGALDSRVLWAALTPRGTQHFLTDNYPHEGVSDPYHDDNQYETIEAMHYKANLPDKFAYAPVEKKIIEKNTFDNSGFMEYDYEDPAPLIEAYQLDELESCYQEPEVNPYCVNQLPAEAFGTLRRGSSRPLVSSPTRIEHPNLPPLNLYPHRPATLRRSAHSRRVSDTNSFSGNLAI